MLRDFLAAAGAQVVLTRTKAESLTAIDRLRVTESFNAERVIVIDQRGGPSVGHYFSSPGGKALAKRIADRLGARVVESPGYLVQQTAAVAVAINAPGAPDKEAYAIYLALLEDFGSTDALELPVAVTPAAVVPVTLDGRWTLLTGADGKVTFEALPAGAVVTVSAAGASKRVTLPVKEVTLP
jgi:hypothetical protein